MDSFTTDNTDGGPTARAVQQRAGAGAAHRGRRRPGRPARADHPGPPRRVRPRRRPYGGIGADAVGTAEHRALAREAAGEAMVLLENDGTLPLDSAADRTVAVVGPLADTLYTDWYSGALPYEVTPADGVREHLGDGATVRVSEGVDRIALREVGTGKYVTGGTGPDGAVLAANGTSAAAGRAVRRLRVGRGRGHAAQRRQRQVRRLRRGPVPQRPGPAQRLVRAAAVQARGAARRHLRGPLRRLREGVRLVRAEPLPDGRRGRHARARRGHRPTRRRASRRRSSATASPRRSRPPRAPTRWSSSWAACRSSTAARTTTGPAWTSRSAQRRLVEGVAEANPRTVMVLENSYPTTIGWARDAVPAVLWTSHAGQETGNALADVLFGDRNPAGRLTQTWYASDQRPARHHRLRHPSQRHDLPVLRG